MGQQTKMPFVILKAIYNSKPSNGVSHGLDITEHLKTH